MTNIADEDRYTVIQIRYVTLIEMPSYIYESESWGINGLDYVSNSGDVWLDKEHDDYEQLLAYFLSETLAGGKDGSGN